MPVSLPQSDSSSRPLLGRAAQWLEVALLFLVFAAYAGWPVPDPNEPHYLGKAKHYWNPTWIEHDFFLDSADSHWAFYVTLGWLSRWLTLPALAWTGRLVTWALLACAWRRLSWSLLPRWGAATVSAILFVALNENCQMAGEWVVGGFEAKGLAYALVIAALAEVVVGRWNVAWALLGGACAFHILVGGWSCVCVGIAWLASGAQRPRLWGMLPGLAAAAVLALPGLIPALRLTTGADPDIVAQANEIYVYQRLPHHLSFFRFNNTFRLWFAGLILAWGLLARFSRGDARAQLLRRVVNASLALVAVGIGVSAVGLMGHDLAAGLLRFYWFRLADVLLPLGVALGATAAASRWSASQRRWPSVGPLAVAALGIALLQPELAARWKTTVPRADKPGKIVNFADWRDACAWVAANTPPEARFLTPRTAQTFKWYAGRSEVVTWKDLPQDAPSIVAWWQRLRDVYGREDPEDPDGPWYDSLAEEDRERLIRLGAKYEAQYVLTEAEPPLDLPRVYGNATYAVYRLTD